jgi:hypothetical protein
MGFVLQKADGSVYFVLRPFTPELIDNHLIFHWSGDLRVYNTDTPEVDLANVQKYLDFITENDNTYIFEVEEDVYELYNPCSQWDYVFFNANQ